MGIGHRAIPHAEPTHPKQINRIKSIKDWMAPHVVIIDFDMAKDFSGKRKGGLGWGGGGGGEPKRDSVFRPSGTGAEGTLLFLLLFAYV